MNVFPWFPVILVIIGIIFLIWNPCQTGNTLFLGSIAISAPYFAEWLKRKYFSPDLQIEYIHKPPYFRQTRYGGSIPVYYAQFLVKNNGLSQAKSCEAVLEELWLPDSSSKLVKETNFLPVNLTWAVEYQGTDGGIRKKLFVDINRHREMYCNIGHVHHPNDRREQSVFYGESEPHNKFFFDINPKPHAQPDCILPGKAKIKVGIYADNAPRREKEFEIEWSGVWQGDDEEAMRNEIKIRPV